MSVSGISTDNQRAQYTSLPAQNKFQQAKQGFQQLGQDLQAGSLSQAQSDFAALQQFLPGGAGQSPATTSSSITAQTGSPSGNPIAAAISQLGSDLQAGNLTAAQSDYANIKQDVQQAAAPQGSTQAHHHHHPHPEDQASSASTDPTATSSSSSTSSSQNPISALLAQLGQAIQTGSLAGPQQAYSTLQQDFQQFGLGAGTNGLGGSSASSSADVPSSTYSVTA